MKRAVITGVGVVSAFGVGANAFFRALSAGRSAVGPIRSFDATSFPTRVAGEVPVGAITAQWLTEQLPELGQTHRLFLAAEQSGSLRDRKVGFGVLAAAEAWRSAGCGESETDAWLTMASGLEQAWLQDFAPILAQGEVAWAHIPHAALPEVCFRSRVDLGPELIAASLNLRGQTIVNASACAAGSLAVAQAASLVERGAASLVLCGGADSMVNPLGVGGMSRLGAPSPRAEVDACRPFDLRRDGLAMGEGAAMFVVESEERAEQRGVKPLARILGWGSTQDAYRVTAPRPDGSAAARAMERALARAALRPEDIGYLNAHGTGTALNDAAEAKAIRDTFGVHTDTMWVSSIKGAIGHLMAASGAIELASCLLAFKDDLLPGTAHHRHPDPACALNVIGERPRTQRVEAVLSNSFGFGGQNACVILGRAC